MATRRSLSLFEKSVIGAWWLVAALPCAMADESDVGTYIQLFALAVVVVLPLFVVALYDHISGPAYHWILAANAVFALFAPMIDLWWWWALVIVTPMVTLAVFFSRRFGSAIEG